MAVIGLVVILLASSYLVRLDVSLAYFPKCTLKRQLSATLLGLRFKGMYFTAGEKDAAKSVIFSVLRAAAVEATSTTHLAAAVSDQLSTLSSLAAARLADTEADQSASEMSLSLWDNYENFAEESQDISTPSEDTHHIFEVQLDNYFREPRVSCATNIYAS